MKRLLLILTLTLATVPIHAADWVEKTFRAMSLDEKIGQLLLPYAPAGGFRAQGSEDFARLRENLANYHLGGIHVRQGDPAGVALLVNDLQRVSKVPLLISADFEGGVGYIMPGATRLPLAMAIGATGSEDHAAAAGRITAIEGHAMGVGVQFYPVVDVQNNPRNPIINIRSFGEDPAKVSSLATAYLRAVQENGMLATAKHFPGHGDVDADSHLVMPALDVSRARLDAVELPPFRAAIEAGVAAVMSAHIYLPALEPEKNLPATLSRNVLTSLLRDELRFQGLVFSDAMDMGGITAMFDEREAVLRTLEAGADVVLFPPHVDVAFEAIREAVASGRLSEARVDASVRRILAAKKRLGLDRYRPADLASLSARLGTSEHRAAATRIMEEAVTLVRDERGVLPLAPSAETRVLHVALVDSRDGWREGTVGLVSAAEVRKRFPRTTSARVDTVVVSVFIRVGSYKGSIDLSAPQIGLLRGLAGSGKPFVLVLHGSPFLLQSVPDLPSYVLTYDTHPDAERAAVRALTGEIPFRGRLPVSLPGLHPRGHGLATAARP